VVDEGLEDDEGDALGEGEKGEGDILGDGLLEGEGDGLGEGEGEVEVFVRKLRDATIPGNRDT